jgi:type II secretory pathway component GspD/PulD (secretin)
VRLHERHRGRHGAEELVGDGLGGRRRRGRGWCGGGSVLACGALGGQFAILSVPQMSATLRLLNEDKDAEFLANPRVVTASNQKAEIKITRNQPVPQLNFNEQTAQAVFSGFQDKEFGNTLQVTPSINKDDFVTMLVKPEISTSPGDVNFTFGGLGGNVLYITTDTAIWAAVLNTKGA